MTLSSRRDLVPCPRCGKSTRIYDVALRGVEAARAQALERHQQGAACRVATFARAQEARDMVRVGKAWRLVREGLIPHELGPTAPAVTHGGDVVTGVWIPRWAAISYWASDDFASAKHYAATMAASTEEERAALLTAYDAGGLSAARLLIWNLASSVEGKRKWL